MGGFLAGILSPALTATSQAISGEQQGNIKGIMETIQLARQKREDELKQILQGAQVKDIDSRIFDREHPIDLKRAATIDTRAGTSAPIGGMSPEPQAPVLGSPEYRQAQKDLESDKTDIQREQGYHPPPPEDKSLVQVPDDKGVPVWTPRADAIGKHAPSPNARGTAAIMKDVAANQTQVSVIDDALHELNAHPDAVGLKRGAADLPWIGGAADAINQRVDPEGVAARASLANVSSLVIKDRSGSAVTVSESARLRPFIPSTGDTPETIRIKLGKLRQAIEVETKLLQQSSGMKNDSHTGASEPGGTIDLGKGAKVPSASQRQRASVDPEYRQFLIEQGYHF